MQYLDQLSFHSILVVEDDASIREPLVALLRFEGYTVAAVENGAEALEYLSRHQPPRLILLDLMMPVMDGWQFMDEVRKSELFQNIPVVVSSAVVQLHGLPRGATAALPKPYDFQGLMEVVERYGPEAERLIA